MKNKGFTLIEVLVVILFIGILSILVISKVVSAISDSKNAVSEASANTLVSALEDYYFEAKLKGEFNACTIDFDNVSNTCTGFSFSGNKPTSGSISLSADGIISGEFVIDESNFIIVDNKICN